MAIFSEYILSLIMFPKISCLFFFFDTLSYSYVFHCVVKMYLSILVFRWNTTKPNVCLGELACGHVADMHGSVTAS